ncbi:MAG: hypothetical protein SV062_04660, partial [Thermodesulfobacteriota bacterium]|nr:hypothetical protein [Thermodesulfobacteriota bacterium]
SKTFNNYLNNKDILILQNIYDAGGKALRDISSQDLLDLIRIPNCLFIKERPRIISIIRKIIRNSDIIVLMGARDNTLSDFAHRIWKEGIIS